MPERSMEQLLTVDEVADLLRLSRGSVYHMVSQGRLPCIRLSKRCLRFSRQAVDSMQLSLGWRRIFGLLFRLSVPQT